MNRSQTVRSLINEITSITSHPSDDLLENDETRQKILDCSRKLTVAAENPGDVAFQTSLLPIQALCARLAIELGLFNQIAKADQSPISIQTLATVSRSQELLVARILRVLAAMGYVQEVGLGAFVATPVTKAFSNPALQACHIHRWDYGLPALQSMVPYFQKNGYESPTSHTDGPLQYACKTDLSVYDYWATLPGALENFNVFMTGVRASRPMWLDWFPVQEELLQGVTDGESPPLLVDIAGGRGHDLIRFTERFPGVKRRLILQDLPRVIESNSRLEGIEQMEYDFFTAQPVHGAQIYFLHFTLHNWADEEVIKIFRNIASAMDKDFSRLFVNELCLPDTGCSVFSAAMDIFMMSVHTGAERTEGRWRSLVDSAGLMIKKIWPAPGGGEGIIEVVRKE